MQQHGRVVLQIGEEALVHLHAPARGEASLLAAFDLPHRRSRAALSVRLRDGLAPFPILSGQRVYRPHAGSEAEIAQHGHQRRRAQRGRGPQPGPFLHQREHERRRGRARRRAERYLRRPAVRRRQRPIVDQGRRQRRRQPHRLPVPRQQVKVQQDGQRHEHAAAVGVDPQYLQPQRIVQSDAVAAVPDQPVPASDDRPQPRQRPRRHKRREGGGKAVKKAQALRVAARVGKGKHKSIKYPYLHQKIIRSTISRVADEQARDREPDDERQSQPVERPAAEIAAHDPAEDEQRDRIGQNIQERRLERKAYLRQQKLRRAHRHQNAGRRPQQPLRLFPV